MRWNEIKAGDLQAAENALRVALGPNASLVAQRLREEPDYAKFVAEQAVARDEKLTRLFDESCRTEWNRAFAIMGVHFFPPVAMAKAWPTLHYDRADLRKLVESLPPSDVLERLRQRNFVLLPGPPRQLSLEDLRTMKVGTFMFRHDPSDDAFYKYDKVKSGWLAMTVNPTEESIGLGWAEQRRLHEPVENIPNVAEVSWGLITYLATIPAQLVWKTGVRTSSIGSLGGNVIVWCESNDRLSVEWPPHSVSKIGKPGILVSRKFRKK